jgi:hypothetical protein
VRVIAIRRPPPWLGDCPSFYRPRRKQFTSVPHYFAYVWRHGVQCHGVDGCPGESRSCWGIMASPVPVQEQIRGWWRRGWLSGRHPRAGSRVSSTGGRTRHSGGCGDVLSPCASTALGMSSQYPVWRCSGGDGRTGLTVTGKTAPAGLTSRRNPV